MVFRANPAIIAKFPIMSALAHGGFTGLAAEATSERTIGYSGRVFSTLRRNVSPEKLCAMVVGAACPLPVGDTEFMAEYETRSDRRERREAEVAAKAATVAAAAEAPSNDDDSPAVRPRLSFRTLLLAGIVHFGALSNTSSRAGAALGINNH